MATEKYSDLLKVIVPEYGVPELFFTSAADNGNACIYLVSCLNKDNTILFLEDSFESLTGYSSQMLVNEGLGFFFPLIHRDDLANVSQSIVESHGFLNTPGFKRPFPPLILNYRFKTASGIWENVRETKYLLLSGDDVAIDKVLCKLEFVDQTPKQSCSRLLDFALTHREMNSNGSRALSKSNDPVLTAREMEILRLIGKGLSTKLIADKCCISINTVETHRRHLLEKLKVKNSVELIKEASRRYSLD